EILSPLWPLIETVSAIMPSYAMEALLCVGAKGCDLRTLSPVYACTAAIRSLPQRGATGRSAKLEWNQERRLSNDFPEDADLPDPRPRLHRYHRRGGAGSRRKRRAYRPLHRVRAAYDRLPGPVRERRPRRAPRPRDALRPPCARRRPGLAPRYGRPRRHG